ncbi:MAG: TlpA disulfide reductase family protein [Saprospiraceae bacterium]
MKITLYSKTLMLSALMSFFYYSEAQVVDDFILDNINNEQVSLEEIKGENLTIIDFWATWCKPCTKAMPKLNELYLKYKDQGVSMIGISCDGPRSISKVSAVANNLKIDYHILKDIDCEVMNSYQFQAFPTLVIIDNNKEIVWVHEGFGTGDEREIEQAIMDHLK